MKKGILPCLMLLLFTGFSCLFGQTESEEKSIWEQLIEKRNPLKPIGFGFDSEWIAVKTTETEKLLQVLDLKNLEKSNWVEGTLKTNKGYVFVLPPVGGWILISSFDLPSPDSRDEKEASRSRALLNQLSKSFGEAQMFGSLRSSSSAFWMKSVNGSIERLYSIVRNHSTIEGKPTPVEASWTLFDSSSPDAETDEYWFSALSPDMETVMEVAESWSINPLKVETYKGLAEYGYTGILKKE
ncbi:MAG: hypothetical protein HUU01_11470 [Saprospiraceae bacterium]|nr:hypothetical protein [Saprospiraceae bacterium]